MLKNVQGLLSRGKVDWGRPVRETRPPVNMGNQPHCDNGEEVASATSLPTDMSIEDRPEHRSEPQRGGMISNAGGTNRSCRPAGALLAVGRMVSINMSSLRDFQHGEAIG